MKANKQDKHQAFVNEYMVNGRNGKRAYMTVYQVTNEKTAEVNSSKLLGNTKIQALLEVEEAKVAEKYNIKKEDIIKILKDLIDEAIGDKDRGNATQAVKELNKMLGYYADTNTNVTLKGEAAIKTIQIIPAKKQNLND